MTPGPDFACAVRHNLGAVPRSSRQVLRARGHQPGPGEPDRSLFRVFRLQPASGLDYLGIERLLSALINLLQWDPSFGRDSTAGFKFWGEADRAVGLLRNFAFHRAPASGDLVRAASRAYAGRRSSGGLPAPWSRGRRSPPTPRSSLPGKERLASPPGRFFFIWMAVVYTSRAPAAKSRDVQ